MARQLGLDIADHRTRAVNARALARQDLILVMEQGHKEALRSEFPALRRKVYLLSEVVDRLTYDIPDPADPYVEPWQALQKLEQLIEKGSGKIIELAESL